MKARSCLLLFLLLCSTWAWAASRSRTVRSCTEPYVRCAVGDVPQLPARLWATFDDGGGAWLQVRWSQSDALSERQLADSLSHPAGSHYWVQGHLLGYGAVPFGHPVRAHVSVVARRAPVPSPQPVARPLPLADVRLTGDNRLTRNRELLVRQLLSWSPRQQLYNYRDTYGLPTSGYPVSDGWDSPTTKLKGHGTGHYLSALAFAYASESDTSLRDSLRQRIRFMVDELRQCQERTFVWDDSLGRYWEARDLAPEPQLRHLQGTWQAFDAYKRDFRHYGYGYLNAIPAQHAVLIEMYRPYNNEQGVWAPYYTIHKQLAGLIDIARCVDETALAEKALLIARDMGLWVWNRLHYRTYVQSEGTVAQRRERPGNRFEMWNIYIAGEVGGMAESLAALSEMVPDSLHRARLLEAANYFDSPAFFLPLERGIDDIRTRHANQHIPMITGALRSYRSNGNPFYYRLARNFWNLLQGRYLYATGGVGNGEMFRQPYAQMMSMLPNPHINETCCAYNLAKLTRDLNTYTPDDARLMDYYECVLSNQLVGSFHPTRYGVTYQYAVGLHASKPFGNTTPQSSCCGGTGAETPVKYPEATYFVSDSVLWVALYLPTEAKWREQGVTIQQQCQWPAQRSTLHFSGDGCFALRLRVPYWATQGFSILLNGRPVSDVYAPSSYVEIPRRRWSSSDVVEINMPFQPHFCFGPDKVALRPDDSPEWLAALMLGPLVMATPDVHTWDQARWTDAEAILSASSPAGIPSSWASVPCRLGGYDFYPDYALTDSATHYLRFPSLAGEASRHHADKSLLLQALQLAAERQQAQQAWQALAVKVPDYAPWAPYGYQRMLQQQSEAQQVAERPSRRLSQQRIDAALSSLNRALNTMRPGNLAEPEDLAPLLPLLEEACRDSAALSPARRQAVDYARMVVQYVTDGSGTHDLIRRAIERLRSAQ